MPNISDSIFGFCVSVLIGTGCAEMGYMYIAVGFGLLAFMSAALFLLAYLNGSE